MEPESFIQPGGLQGFAMILSCGLSCLACRISGIISAWSCAIEKFASVGSATPLLSSNEYTDRAMSEAPIGLRMKLSPMPLALAGEQIVHGLGELGRLVGLRNLVQEIHCRVCGSGSKSFDRLINLGFIHVDHIAAAIRGRETHAGCGANCIAGRRLSRPPKPSGRSRAA